jgi:hypothetical protein
MKTNQPTRALTRAEYVRRKWAELSTESKQRLANDGAGLARWQRLTGLNYRNWADWVNR